MSRTIELTPQVLHVLALGLSHADDCRITYTAEDHVIDADVLNVRTVLARDHLLVDWHGEVRDVALAMRGFRKSPEGPRTVARDTDPVLHGVGSGNWRDAPHIVTGVRSILPKGTEIYLDWACTVLIAVSS